MKFLYMLIIINLILIAPKCYADEKIEYGYDYRENYVTIKVGRYRIEYGYDYRGNYVSKKKKEK